MLVLFSQGCAYAHDESMLQNHTSFKYTALNLKYLECAEMLIDFSLRQYSRSYETEYLIH